MPNGLTKPSFNGLYFSGLVDDVIRGQKKLNMCESPSVNLKPRAYFQITLEILCYATGTLLYLAVFNIVMLMNPNICEGDLA